MAMSSVDREALLSRWIKPSSSDEQTQQDRAERMVHEAIKASDLVDMSTVKIYTKGSYPNNTNVRRDSDVDVVVQQSGVRYYGYWDGQLRPENYHGPAYTGLWTPETWRAVVWGALVDRFGSSVDGTGRVAINIPAVPGSRPSADVVPSFNYVRYDSADMRISHHGSCVFPTDNGAKIVNWPQQQLDNGRAFNTSAGGRYKYFVRALKNAENSLVAAGMIKDLPSYFMECLIWNVPAEVMTGSSLTVDFGHVLRHLFAGLSDGTAASQWKEPNRLKWLFKSQKKWTVEDASTLVIETWRYLGYGSS